MADERGAAGGDARAEADGAAGSDEVSARLAELHRRSEELAQRVASFRSDTEQLTADAGGAASGSESGPQPASEPHAEGDHDQDEAQEPAAAAQPRRHRPRPSADAPLRYDDGSASDASDTAAATAAGSEAPAAAAAEPDAPAAAESDAGSDSAAPAADKPEVETPKADKPKTDEPKADKTEEKRPRRGMPGWVRTLRNLVVTVVIIVAAAFALRTWVVAPYYVPSASMEPTLHGCPNCNNDHLLVQKIAYYFHDPRRGDIIVFSKPANWHVDDADLIKRVIGVPGDKLSLRKGRVYINGHKIDESYVNPKCKRGTLPETGKSSWTVPKKRLFVMGDNRCDSEDSRQFGMVPIGNVVGEAFLIYWPVSHFGSP